MADASLTVRMALDRLALKQGLDGAGKDVDGFKKHFESSLRETRGAVKDVAGSIEGIGRAFDGSIGGAVSGLRDLMALIKTSPWLAFATAAAGAITQIASKAEEAAKKEEERIDRLAKKEAAVRKEFRAAMGSGFDPKAEAEKLAADVKYPGDFEAAVKQQTEKLAQAKGEAFRRAQAGEEFQSDLNDKAVMDLLDRASKEAQILKELKDAQTKFNAEFLKNEQEAARKELEERTKNAKKILKEEADKRKKLEKLDKDAKDKRIKIQDEEREKELDVRSKANQDIEELYKREKKTPNFSSGIDIYQKMGGQFGANLDVGRLQRDSNIEKMQREIADINKKMEASLEKIRQNSDIQMDAIKQSQEDGVY